MRATAKVFTTGNSQAIRLPRAYRVEVREMWITKNERTGEITLRPKPEPEALVAFMTALQSTPATEEFLLPRDDAAQADPLAGWQA
jgi:antitoxin VapB